MKGSLTFILMLTILMALGQENPSGFNIKVSPQHLPSFTLKPGVEYLFNGRRQSVSFLPSWMWSKTYEREITGGAMEFQYRLYSKSFPTYRTALEGKQSAGLYISPFFQVSTFRITTEWDDKEIRSADFGLTVGSQFRIRKVLIADLYFGLGHRKASREYGRSILVEDTVSCLCVAEPPDNSRTDPNLDYNGLFPKLGLHLGLEIGSGR